MSAVDSRKTVTDFLLRLTLRPFGHRCTLFIHRLLHLRLALSDATFSASSTTLSECGNNRMTLKMVFVTVPIVPSKSVKTVFGKNSAIQNQLMCSHQHFQKFWWTSTNKFVLDCTDRCGTQQSRVIQCPRLTAWQYFKAISIKKTNVCEGARWYECPVSYLKVFISWFNSCVDVIKGAHQTTKPAFLS